MVFVLLLQKFRTQSVFRTEVFTFSEKVELLFFYWVIFTSFINFSIKCFHIYVYVFIYFFTSFNIQCFLYIQILVLLNGDVFFWNFLSLLFYTVMVRNHSYVLLIVRASNVFLTVYHVGEIHYQNHNNISICI